MKRISWFDGSVLIEGIIVLGLIGMTIGYMFSALRLHSDISKDRIINDRATYILSGTIEQIRSARDSAVNAQRVRGWNNFIQPVKDNMGAGEKALLMIARAAEGSEMYAPSQLYFVPFDEDLARIDSEVRPYTTYTILIKAWFDEGKEEALRCSVIVSWEGEQNTEWIENANWDATGSDAVVQDVLLTDYRMTDNVF